MKKVVVVTSNIQYSKVKIANLLEAFGIEFKIYRADNKIELKDYTIKLVNYNNINTRLRGCKFDIGIIDRSSGIQDEKLYEVVMNMKFNVDKVVDI